MLVKSTLFLLSFFLLEDPVQQAQEFRTSQVVVREVRELLTKIEPDSPLIDKSNLAAATGFVNSDLPVSESRLGEYCVGLLWSGHNQEMLNVMRRDSLNYEDRKTLTFHVGLALTMNNQFELLDRVLQGSELKYSFLNFAYRESYARGNDRACEWIRSKITLNFEDEVLERISRSRTQHKNRTTLLEIIGIHFANADLDSYASMLDDAPDEAHPRYSQRGLLSAIQQCSTVSDELLEQIKKDDESSPILLKYRLIHEGLSCASKGASTIGNEPILQR